MFWLILFLALDLGTTAFGLRLGIAEMNPVVASILRADGLQGLLFTKLVALALAAYFLYTGRLLLLRRVTVLMGLVVGWNLFWIMAR